MDISTLGAAIALVKKMPDTAISRAEEAATAAEAAADRAEEHGYGISVSGTKLIITNPTGGDE